MIPIQRIVLAVVSAIAGLTALYLIRSPGSIANAKAIELGAVTVLIAANICRRGRRASQAQRVPQCGEQRGGDEQRHRAELQDLFVREAARAADQVERSEPGDARHDGKHDALDRDHDGCKPATLVCGEASRCGLRQTCMARLPKLPRDGRSLPR